MTRYDPGLVEENVAEIGWDEGKELPEGFFGASLPKPLYWRMLVMPVRPKKVSSGGIVLPVSTQEAQQYLNYMGKVIAIGSSAGKDKRLEGENAFPKVGEYVIYGRYAGQVLTYKGVRLVIINDDEILAVVTDPDSMKIHL